MARRHSPRARRLRGSRLHECRGRAALQADGRTAVARYLGNAGVPQRGVARDAAHAGRAARIPRRWRLRQSAGIRRAGSHHRPHSGWTRGLQRRHRVAHAADAGRELRFRARGALWHGHGARVPRIGSQRHFGARVRHDAHLALRPLHRELRRGPVSRRAARGARGRGHPVRARARDDEALRRLHAGAGAPWR